MIIGIGIDLIKINRITKILIKNKIPFINKIFSTNEIELLSNISTDKLAHHIAKRFAAKEAFAKAIGRGIGSAITFKEIEVFNDPMGRPFIVVPSKIYDDLMQNVGYDNLKIKSHLSLSDEKEYAIAQVIIETSII